MSQSTRARALAPIAGFSYQQALTHLRTLKLGPRGEEEYIVELRSGAKVEPITCGCGCEFLVAFGAQGRRVSRTEFHVGSDPRGGGQKRVSDTCPRCTLIYSMVEWFYENFEDPASLSAGSTAFLAATLRLGIAVEAEQELSRADAKEVLQEEFPEAPMDVVVAACEHTYGAGADWVRKAGYPRRLRPEDVIDFTGIKAHTDW